VLFTVLGGYSAFTETSMATPHAAGMVTLLIVAACDEWITLYKSNLSQYILDIRNYVLNVVDQISAYDLMVLLLLLLEVD